MGDCVVEARTAMLSSKSDYPLGLPRESQVAVAARGKAWGKALAQETKATVLQKLLWSAAHLFAPNPASYDQEQNYRPTTRTKTWSHGACKPPRSQVAPVVGPPLRLHCWSQQVLRNLHKTLGLVGSAELERTAHSPQHPLTLHFLSCAAACCPPAQGQRNSRHRRGRQNVLVLIGQSRDGALMGVSAS